MNWFLTGAGLGLSTAAYCFFTCGLALAGWAVSVRSRSQLPRVLLFLSGRFVVYALTAGLFIALTGSFHSFLEENKRLFYILNGCVLLILPTGSDCANAPDRPAFLLGLLSGLTPCAPFLGLLGAALTARDSPAVLLSFAGFFLVSSIVLLSGLLPARLIRTEHLRKAGRIVLSFIAILFLFRGLFGINGQMAVPSNGMASLMMYYLVYAAVLAVSALAAAGWWIRSPVYRIAVMTGAALLLGPVFGTFVSIGDLRTLWSGGEAFAYLSPLLVLFFFALTAAGSGEENIYCGMVCPFGCCSEILNQVCRKAGIRVRDSRWRSAGFLPFVVFGGTVVLFILSKPGGIFFVLPEPFAWLFRPVNVWFFLAAVGLLVLSVFDRRFYCKYLCGLSGLFRILAGLRRLSLIGRKDKQTLSS